MNKLATRRSGTPTTYEPVGLFDELERLRTRLMETVGIPMATSGGWTAAPGDLEETETEFIVNVEVPGFDADDLNIEQEGRRLMVHAERDEEERSGTMRGSTRSSRHLHHEVWLPADVDAEGIQANLDRGILTITMPKSEGGERRQIEITGS